MTAHATGKYRVSGILFAHDPAGVGKFGQADEYDLYCEEILACETRDELEAVLRNKDLYGLKVFGSLKHYLGMDETVEELYPAPPHERTVPCRSTTTQS